MNPLISVIVPVFNVQRFLPKCIESILKQSYKSLELILIDDGSTDHSLAICKKYEKKDGRIVVISQQNGGVSSARNHGLKVAKGEYICFVDSDDWIPRKSIQVLYEAISKEDADLAVGAIKTIIETGKQVRFNPETVIHIEKNGEKFLNYVRQMYPGPVAKLYKKVIIGNNSLQFPTSMAVGEDTLFLCSYLENCKTIISVSDTVYFYNRLNGSSATHKYYSGFGDWIVLIVDAFDRLCKRVDSPLTKETVSYLTKIYLMWGIKNYVLCNLNRIEAIKRIKNVYGNLKPYISEKADIECTSLNEETIHYYLSKEGGAETVYDELKRQVSAEKRKTSAVIKKFIKRILKAIKLVWYFDLKM